MKSGKRYERNLKTMQSILEELRSIPGLRVDAFSVVYGTGRGSGAGAAVLLDEIKYVLSDQRNMQTPKVENALAKYLTEKVPLRRIPSEEVERAIRAEEAGSLLDMLTGRTREVDRKVGDGGGGGGGGAGYSSEPHKKQKRR